MHFQAITLHKQADMSQFAAMLAHPTRTSSLQNKDVLGDHASISF